MVEELINKPEKNNNEVKALDLNEFKNKDLTESVSGFEVSPMSEKTLEKTILELDSEDNPITPFKLKVESVGNINYGTFKDGGSSYTVPLTCSVLEPISRAIVHQVGDVQKADSNGQMRTVKARLKGKRQEDLFETVENYDGTVGIWLKLGSDDSKFMKEINETEYPAFKIGPKAKAYSILKAFMVKNNLIEDDGKDSFLHFLEGFVPSLKGFEFECDIEKPMGTTYYRIKAKAL